MSQSTKESAHEGVSVCIPCFNSSARLPETLRHLQKQRVPAELPWEVIVIDNASTDDTSAAAVKIWAGCSAAPLRVVREPRAGLSHARACAFRESYYEFVAFVDDDNWVCEDWIALVHEILSEHPDVGACGGLGRPAFEGEAAPEWFWRFQDCYATGPQGDHAGYVAPTRGYLHGAGLSIRMSAWHGLVSRGFESTLAGRTGQCLSSGEDTELSYAFQLAGWRLWYDPRLKFQHFMPQGRLNEAYLMRLTKGIYAADVWLSLYVNLLRPSQTEFRWLRVSSARAREIRELWLFQLYAAIRSAVFALTRLLHTWRDNDFDTDVQWVAATARLSVLLLGPIRYWRIQRKLKHAEWIQFTATVPCDPVVIGAQE